MTSSLHSLFLVFSVPPTNINNPHSLQLYLHNSLTDKIFQIWHLSGQPPVWELGRGSPLVLARPWQTPPTHSADSGPDLTLRTSSTSQSGWSSTRPTAGRGRSSNSRGVWTREGREYLVRGTVLSALSTQRRPSSRCTAPLLLQPSLSDDHPWPAFSQVISVISEYCPKLMKLLSTSV